MPPPPPPFPGGPTGMEEKPEVSPMMIFLNVTNTITHLCLGAAAVIAIIVANTFFFRTSLTTHIYMCTVGYVILLAVGFMAFDPSSSLRMSFQYPQKRLSYLILQIIGSSIAIIGSIIRLADSPYNFQTAHGTLGLVAMLLTILSLIGGVINFISSEKNNRALIATLHTCLGTLAIIMAFVTLCLGFDMTSLIIGVNNKNLAIGVTSVGLVGIVLSPTIHLLKRVM